MVEKLEPVTVSIAEAARLLGVSRTTMYGIMNQAGFPSFKVKGRVLISVEGLREWVRKQTEEAAGA